MMYTKYKPYTKEKHVQVFRRVIKKYGFGLTINLETLDINIVENYLNYYEGRKFYENCQKYLEIIKKDQIEFLKNITCFLKC